VLFIMVVMAGRVIPMFTNNGVPGANAMRHTGLEQAALASVIALMLADAAQLYGLPMTALLLVCALLHTTRWLLWRPWKTRRQPLVWVLHAAYAWIPVHLALRALGEFVGTPPSLATHALTAGAIGALVIGMMTRTARGHTGLPLRADRTDVACYLLVLLAGVVRVIVPLAMPALYVEAVIASAALWSAGFGLYAWHYWPVLTRSRLDGLPG